MLSVSSEYEEGLGLKIRTLYYISFLIKYFSIKRDGHKL